MSISFPSATKPYKLKHSEDIIMRDTTNTQNPCSHGAGRLIQGAGAQGRRGLRLRRLNVAVWMVVCLLAASPLRAYEFAGGTGEPNDPYRIATAAQLISIGLNEVLLGSHFVLIDDIDLNPNNPESQVFDYAVIAPRGPRPLIQWLPGGSGPHNQGPVCTYKE